MNIIFRYFSNNLLFHSILLSVIVAILYTIQVCTMRQMIVNVIENEKGIRRKYVVEPIEILFMNVSCF